MRVPLATLALMISLSASSSNFTVAMPRPFSIHARRIVPITLSRLWL
nr:MAG TPA: hypothetical protein [Caudoviricetes sp.]